MIESKNKLENSELETNSGLDATMPTNETTSPSLGRRGTGPRTLQGKANSKRNAIKHGIGAKEVVARGESRGEFNAFMGGLYDAFQPVGAYEENLVESLAVTRWRQRRVLTAESAEIEAAQLTVYRDDEQREMAEARHVTQSYYKDGLIKKIDNSIIIDRCIVRLRALKDAIETSGFNPDLDKPELDLLYGVPTYDSRETDPHIIYRRLEALAHVPEDEKKNFPSPGECKKLFVEELKKEIHRLEHYIVNTVLR